MLPLTGLIIFLARYRDLTSSNSVEELSRLERALAYSAHDVIEHEQSISTKNQIELHHLAEEAFLLESEGRVSRFMQQVQTGNKQHLYKLLIKYLEPFYNNFK